MASVHRPLQPIDLAVPTPVSVYLKSIANFCPFIEPSGKAGLLFGSVITPDCETPADIHSRIFEQIVPAIERFRDDRKALSEKQQRLLICHTIVIHVPPQLDVAVAQQLQWPNWLGWAIKQFYTPKEIVFGVVRKNLIEQTMTGSPITPSPFHAIVIRSRAVGSDHRFFTGNQSWLDALMEADDDGANVHEAMLGTVPDIRDPQAMREGNYFQRVQQWGQRLLPKV